MNYEERKRKQEEDREQANRNVARNYRLVPSRKHNPTPSTNAGDARTRTERMRNSRLRLVRELPEEGGDGK